VGQSYEPPTRTKRIDHGPSDSERAGEKVVAELCLVFGGVGLLGNLCGALASGVYAISAAFVDDPVGIGEPQIPALTGFHRT
jgi:hypothetical protein